MTQGFKATLFAGVITLGVVAPVFAAAPVITDIPDVTIGDLEDAVADTFVYDAPFSLNDYVTYDGAKSGLLWSFGESENDGAAANEYTINGVGAAVSGDANLAAEETGHANTLNPTTPIPTTSTTTLFRDIAFSPVGGPNSTPTAGAADGKVVTYYVSDGTNVDSAQALIRTVDGAADSLSASEGWVERVDDSDFSSSGWVSSGIQSEGVSNSKVAGALKITLTPTSGKSRVFGWVNNSLLDYNDVGANRFVRGKFYISTSNFILSPVNETPAFRLRVTNAGSINAAAHFEYVQTAISAPAHEPRYAQAANPTAEAEAGFFLRPGDIATVPSLYRVNLDPVDVAAAAGSKIGALMESYSFSDAANGELTLHEVILGTYDALSDAQGTVLFNYNRTSSATPLIDGEGGPKQMTGGPFNFEANFENGRRQKLFFPGFDAGSYATNTNEGANGLVGSTELVPTSLFGVDLLNVESLNNADKLRIEPGKLYNAKFYATSDMKAESSDPNEAVQGNLRFRFQTAASTLSYLMEVTSVAGPDLSEDGVADDIAAQALPGINSTNPDTDPSLAFAGENGGWYSVVVSSPISSDGIRQDYEDFDAFGGGGFFTLGAQPGPGSASASHKDVVLGVDLIQVATDITVTGPTGPVVAEGYAQPNHSVVRIGAVEVRSYPEVNDGGYDYDGNAL